MKKIILKTALKTLAALAAALVIGLTILFLGFPQHMATFAERTGDYNTATAFSSLRYKYTGDTDDLARTVRDAIFAGNDKKTVKYGDKLILKTDFDEYCAEQNEYLSTTEAQDYAGDYKQFICGSLASAKYRRGDAEGAIKVALDAVSSVTDFTYGNALAALSVEVIKKDDAETARKLLPEVEKFKTGEALADITQLLEETALRLEKA